MMTGDYQKKTEARNLYEHESKKYGLQWRHSTY